MRNRFNRQLDELNTALIKMGAMCEEAISGAAKSLSSGDISLAISVKENGSEIDRIERDIEQRCMKLLLHQQPVAKDLRQVSAALKMITDMERIGDQAEDIAEIITSLGARTTADVQTINKMSEATVKMVTDSIDAFVHSDVVAAQAVIDSDSIVDDYFDQIKYSIIEVIADNRSDGEYALDLLMIAKYLERIGDHATNIAEWVIYSVTGHHEEEH